ncbi:MAG: response regulator [Hyphomicrobiales bacterium]|nr:response regulator [Hyphomicrobiales bacterium]MCP5372539.1 response regulator [Hyphomicrobiales bacterium]
MVAHILVVDDEPDLELLVRQKFRRQVRAQDYDLSFAHDGEEALAMVKADPDLDIVLTDINMPRMDGLTLLNRLQDFPRLLRVVMVSAYGDMENIRTAMNCGAFDFVTKPIDFEDLEKTIAKTLADLATVREAQDQRSRAERARANLARHFSPSLADYLADHPERLEPGGERREITFLFTDLADFTPLVEHGDPDRIVALLNDYLNTVAGIIFDHGGTVNAVIGDAVHALFGAPMEQRDHAARAVACALAVDAFARQFAAAKRAEGLPLGLTRIGVHTGSAVIGNFGGDLFFHYTAHGDAVNTTARLETANKRLGTRVCVSADTVAQIPDFLGRPVGTLRLKGKENPIAVFEPLPDDPAVRAALAEYTAAFDKLAAGDADAVASLAAFVSTHPDDRLAAFHLERLLAGHGGPDISLADE